MKTLLTAITIIIAMTIQAQETATFGGGCFWCTEAVFSQLKGVSMVESGYSGGEVKNPSYKDVCSGLTGHAEVIQITFDPDLISFADLLEVFFATHDPTTLNRQGADVGTQYRSVVFYHNEKQKETTDLVIKSLDAEHIFDRVIVTEVSPFSVFYPAEDYHQDYFANNSNQPYCRAVIVPKMDKFKKLFKEKIK
nr:peptide-methionine (S)-S-oxide reductase MsrA [uncultured Carboxylicivirga sp.]